MIKAKRMRWADHVAYTGEMRTVYRILVRGPEERDHLENIGVNRRIICIKMDLREIGWENANWIHMAQIGTSSGLL
jgi:hypothetical protein